MTRRALIAFAVLACPLSACSGKSSVLTAGYQTVLGTRPSPNSAEAVATAQTVELEWTDEVNSRARRYPQPMFANPPRGELMRDLHRFAQRYDFSIVSVQLLRPQQLAPKVVVRTKHYLQLARATAAILKRIDPRAPSSDDAKGWKYEGFYFEALDERGVPFLIADNFWRGPSGGGGQWARSEPLYPFVHG